jgi:choline-sulfatase/uncharacterized sulfatase
MSKPLSVLFILADQHNAKVLGCKGHPDVKTPHLDRLAAEGVRFDNAITQNPICTPSRVCFLSGQYPHNHGYYGLSGPNPRGLPTVLGHFRRAGYRTAAMGKIHCPEYWVEDGCDVFHETCDSSVGGRSPAYAAHLEARGLTALEDHVALNEFGKKGRQSCDGRPSKVSYEDGQEGWCAATASAFMESCSRDGKPFFLHVSLPKPHQCFTPAQPFWDLYDEARLTLPPNADYDMAAAGKSPLLRKAAAHWRKGDWALFEPRTFEAARLRRLHGYLGSVSHVDHAVGQLLEAIDRLGLRDRVLVIYSADHGDYACEHGNMEKAPGICSDAITRIPMIWRLPDQPAAGRVCQSLVEAVDMVPTVCALAGLPPLETADGKDLSPLLKDGNGELHRVAVTEFAWSKSIRKGDKRLVYYPREVFQEDYPGGFGELYDLAADPWEMRNLYFDPAHAATVKELERELFDWLVTTTRPATILPFTPADSPQMKARYNNAVLPDNKIGPDRIRNASFKHYL